MTKQCNFDDVPFSKPGRPARTWLSQKALKGMKVATPSLNWITLSSTFGHGVSVMASDQLPYVGYASPLAIRRAGRLVATTGHFYEDMMATCNRFDIAGNRLIPSGHTVLARCRWFEEDL